MIFGLFIESVAWRHAVLVWFLPREMTIYFFVCNTILVMLNERAPFLKLVSFWPNVQKLLQLTKHRLPGLNQASTEVRMIPLSQNLNISKFIWSFLYQSRTVSGKRLVLSRFTTTLKTPLYSAKDGSANCDRKNRRHYNIDARTASPVSR